MRTNNVKAKTCLFTGQVDVHHMPFAAWAVNKTRTGLLGSDRIVDRIGLRIGSDRITDRIGLAMRLKFPPKWSRDIPRNEDGGEKSMYTIFCN